MKRVFILAGEPSGDRLGAWYVEKQHERGEQAAYVGVGGESMRAAGIELIKNISELSVVGVFEIIKHLPRLVGLRNEILEHILAGNYDEVVVIDFPGFNLSLLNKLKSRCPVIPVTYLAPPQMWAWGAWRLAKLARLSNKIIVLYPFEIAWYADRGVVVEFWGNPVAERLLQNHSITAVFNESRVPEKAWALFPGSRVQEVIQLLPLYAELFAAFESQRSVAHIYISVAPGLSESRLRTLFLSFPQFRAYENKLVFFGQDEHFTVLKKVILVVTKPGTNTLELALLGVPAIVVYQTSWLTYILAKIVVSLSSMTLPNIMTGKILMPEFIQAKKSIPEIVALWKKFFDMAEHNYEAYRDHAASLIGVRAVLAVGSARKKS